MSQWKPKPPRPAPFALGVLWAALGELAKGGTE